jgi:hypothetical protein
MAIELELSSEIATALLTGKERDSDELNDLKETVIKVHSTLQQLAARSRTKRVLSKPVGETERRN